LKKGLTSWERELGRKGRVGAMNLKAEEGGELEDGNRREMISDVPRRGAGGREVHEVSKRIMGLRGET